MPPSVSLPLLSFRDLCNHRVLLLMLQQNNRTPFACSVFCIVLQSVRIIGNLTQFFLSFVAISYLERSKGGLSGTVVCKCWKANILTWCYCSSLLQAEYGLRLASHIFVKDISPESLAARDGNIQEGDVVLKVSKSGHQELIVHTKKE